MDKVFYGMIPPPKSWSQEKVEEWIGELASLLKRENISSINLPEVIDEIREEERTVPLIEKMDNLKFSELIKKACPDLCVYLNKVTVQLSEKKFMEWVAQANQAGIKDLILVGGEKNSTQEIGLSVVHAAECVKNNFPKINLGGITIFTRKGEAQRIFDKMQHGMCFFVSQIIFETANVKCVLLALEKLCRASEQKMPRIYLSLATATSKIDIEFMQWLGVEFPTAVWSYFMDKKENEINERVFEVLNFNLVEIEHFLSETNMDLGFNVEQLMYKNRGSGERLLKLIRARLKSPIG